MYCIHTNLKLKDLAEYDGKNDEERQLYSDSTNIVISLWPLIMILK